MANLGEKFFYSPSEQLDPDVVFMREALKEARKAFKEDEVPVGAVLVYQGKIVARGHNQVEMLQDATAHAEMLAITSAAAHFRNWRLEEATLYCTLEPCPMCAGACFSSRIKKLVWGAPDLRVGASGSWVNLFEKKHPIHQIEIRSGVLAEEAGSLMKQFFQTKRNEKHLR